MPHTLRSPGHLCVTALPIELKEKAQKQLEEHIEWIKNWAVQHPPKEPSEEQFREFNERFDHLSIPQETEYLKLNIVLNEFKNCITFMNSTDTSHLLPEFISYNEQLDALREENTKTIFPELVSIFNGETSPSQHS